MHLWLYKFQKRGTTHKHNPQSAARWALDITHLPMLPYCTCWVCTSLVVKVTVKDWSACTPSGHDSGHPFVLATLCSRALSATPQVTNSILLKSTLDISILASKVNTAHFWQISWDKVCSTRGTQLRCCCDRWTSSETNEQVLTSVTTIRNSSLIYHLLTWYSYSTYLASSPGSPIFSVLHKKRGGTWCVKSCDWTYNTLRWRHHCSKRVASVGAIQMGDISNT